MSEYYFVCQIRIEAQQLESIAGGVYAQCGLECR